MAAPGLELSVARKTVELGKPVWVTLTTNLSRPALNKIDFSALTDQFEVIKDKNEIRQTDKGQAWRLRLYPRARGPLTIPSLSFSSHHSQPLRVQVNKPVDSKTGRVFDVEYRLSSDSPWLRQEVRVTYTIHSDESKLVLAPQQTEIANTLLIPLATATQQQADRFSHTSGWAIYPRKPGAQTFRLPALHYVRDGVVSHRFYPAPVSLNVKALPAYLPGNIPVGRLSLNITALPDMVIKNRLNSLRLELSGDGIPLAWLPDIHRLFTNDQQWIPYPAEIQSVQSRAAGVRSTQHYRLPFKANQQGVIALPAIRLHYFDPVSGKLAQLVLPPPHLFALSAWLLALCMLPMIVVVLWLLHYASAWLRPRWRSLRAYHATLKKLPDIQTAVDAKELITELCRGEGWSANLSLRQWQTKLPPPTARLAAEICHRLEPALYRGMACELQDLRPIFIQFCLKRWPLLRLAHLQR